MNRILPSVLFFVLVLIPAMSQEAVLLPGGPAAGESGWGTLANPALLGEPGSGGIGYFVPPGEDGQIPVGAGLWQNGSLFYNAGLFQQVLTWKKSELFSKLSLALPFAKDLNLAGSLSWPGSRYWDLSGEVSVLFRPWPVLSLGATAAYSASGTAYGTWGAGLRPLGALRSFGDRLTLYADGPWTSSSIELTRAGLILEPMDGIELSGYYDFNKRIWSAGLFVHAGPTSWGAGQELGALSALSRPQWAYGFVASSPRRHLFTPFLKKAVRFSGDLGAPEDSPFARGEAFDTGGRGDLLSSLLLRLRSIAEDPGVQAVVFENTRFPWSWAGLEELKGALLALRSQGKKVFFCYDGFTPGEYYLAAAAADRIFLSPPGFVYLTGLAVNKLYWKDFLADWGITVLNFRSHSHKTAGNQLSEDRMTDEERESYETLLSGMAESLKSWLSNRSGPGRGALDEILSQGPYLSGEKARDKGVVDELAFVDEWKKKIAEEIPGVVFEDFRWENNTGTAWGSGAGPRVELIEAKGDIVYGVGEKGRTIGHESLVAAIRQARQNPLVSGLIIRVDSGGGSALASELIAREIKLCREGPHAKPVVVSMGDVAASGGYFIASAADRIVASETTITGSIGVLALFPQVSGLLEKFKIGSETVETSANGDFGLPWKSMPPKEQALIRKSIEDSYDRFARVVMENRHLDEAALSEAAEGRIWTGRQALEKGLVDRIGGLSEAEKAMRELLNTSSELNLVPVRPGVASVDLSRWLSMLSQERSPGAGGASIPEILKPLWERIQALSRFRSGESLYLLPWDLTIQ